MRLALSALLLLTAMAALAADCPLFGPERIAWMREQLTGTVNKFEFTQGYDFREDPERLLPFMQAIKERGFTVTPVSSNVSRTTASPMLSPGSTPPAG